MILALSPHLDDVVFSCAGYLLQRQRPWRAVTIFTASVPEPTGFALACQTDKGLPPTADYMALRRAEDAAAITLLGGACEHLPYREAPHRGYETAAALFAGPHDAEGAVAGALQEDLRQLITAEVREVLYPVGAGNHVDHLLLIRAVEALRHGFPHVTFRQYFDMPYTRKYPERTPSRIGAALIELDQATMHRKVKACAAYTTQLGFQFGGAGRIAEVLGDAEYIR